MLLNKNTFAINFTKVYQNNYSIRNKLVRTIENHKELNKIFLNKYKINTINFKNKIVGKKIFNQIKNEAKKFF